MDIFFIAHDRLPLVTGTGDNVHRGMILGLLIGAARDIPVDLRDELAEGPAIANEIDAALGALA